MVRNKLSTEVPNMPPGSIGKVAGKLIKWPASKAQEAMSKIAKPIKLKSKNGFSLASTASNFR